MRRVRSSRPAAARSFSILRLNLVLIRGIAPDFRGGVHYFLKPPYAIGSVPRVYRATQLRSDGIYCREFADTGPVVLMVVPETGAALAGHHGPITVRLSFHTPTIGMEWAC